MSQAFVTSSIQDQIATIRFYHPKSNSFPSTQLQKLIDTLAVLGQNEQVKVIVLESEGERVFSAGASFDELLTIQDATTGQDFFMGFGRLLLALRNCPKFVLGKVVGKVVGGGVGIVAGCDYVLAQEHASVRLSELSIGIGPFVIEPAIRRKVGLRTFAEMTLNPKEWKTAAWCAEKGLYNAAYATQEALDAACDEFATQLSHYSLEAMQELKRIFWEKTDDWEEVLPKRAAMSGNLLLTDFTQETLKRQKAK